MAESRAVDGDLTKDPHDYSEPNAARNAEAMPRFADMVGSGVGRVKRDNLLPLLWKDALFFGAACE